jgi:hypothetical protein
MIRLDVETCFYFSIALNRFWIFKKYSYCFLQDLAYGLTDTSRLGCQVCMTKELSGMEINVPEGVHDQRDA